MYFIYVNNEKEPIEESTPSRDDANKIALNCFGKYGDAETVQICFIDNDGNESKVLDLQEQKREWLTQRDREFWKNVREDEKIEWNYTSMKDFFKNCSGCYDKSPFSEDITIKGFEIYDSNSKIKTLLLENYFSENYLTEALLKTIKKSNELDVLYSQIAYDKDDNEYTRIFNLTEVKQERIKINEDEYSLFFQQGSNATNIPGEYKKQIKTEYSINTLKDL